MGALKKKKKILAEHMKVAEKILHQSNIPMGTVQAGEEIFDTNEIFEEKKKEENVEYEDNEIPPTKEIQGPATAKEERAIETSKCFEAAFGLKQLDTDEKKFNYLKELIDETIKNPGLNYNKVNLIIKTIKCCEKNYDNMPKKNEAIQNFLNIYGD